jgi:small conductance mechanosensitive channel
MNNAANPYQVQAVQTVTGSNDTFWSGLMILLQNPFVEKLLDILAAIMITAVLIMVSRWIAWFIKRRITKSIVSRNQESIDKVWTLVGDLVFYGMSAFSIYIWFKAVGMDIGLLMWWLSIGVWFAFREILSNMIAWLMVFSTKEFKIGDVIAISGKVEHPDNKEILFGKIEEITIRYVVVRTFDLRRVVIPSLKFITATVKTYTSEDVVRDEIDFILDIASDISKVGQVIIQAINTLPQISKPEYTEIIVTGYDTKQLKCKAIYAFNPRAGVMNHVVKSKVLAKIVETARVTEFKIV